MNKILTLSLMFVCGLCKAATGNASDGPLMATAVIGIILLLIGFEFFIDFMKRRAKDIKIRNLVKKENAEQDDEILSPFNHAKLELDNAAGN